MSNKKNIYGIQQIPEQDVRSRSDMLTNIASNTYRDTKMTSKFGINPLISAPISLINNVRKEAMGQMEDKRLRNRDRSYNQAVASLSNRAERNSFVSPIQYDRGGKAGELKKKDYGFKINDEFAEVEGGEIITDLDYNYDKSITPKKDDPSHEEDGIVKFGEGAEANYSGKGVLIPFNEEDRKNKHIFPKEMREKVVGLINRYKGGDSNAKTQLDKIVEGLPSHQETAEKQGMEMAQERAMVSREGGRANYLEMDDEYDDDDDFYNDDDEEMFEEASSPYLKFQDGNKGGDDDTYEYIARFKWEKANPGKDYEIKGPITEKEKKEWLERSKKPEFDLTDKEIVDLEKEMDRYWWEKKNPGKDYEVEGRPISEEEKSDWIKRQEGEQEFYEKPYAPNFAKEFKTSSKEEFNNMFSFGQSSEGSISNLDKSSTGPSPYLTGSFPDNNLGSEYQKTIKRLSNPLNLGDNNIVEKKSSKSNTKNSTVNKTSDSKKIVKDEFDEKQRVPVTGEDLGKDNPSYAYITTGKKVGAGGRVGAGGVGTNPKLQIPEDDKSKITNTSNKRGFGLDLNVPGSDFDLGNYGEDLEFYREEGEEDIEPGEAFAKDDEFNYGEIKDRFSPDRYTNVLRNMYMGTRDNEDTTRRFYSPEEIKYADRSYAQRRAAAEQRNYQGQMLRGKGLSAGQQQGYLGQVGSKYLSEMGRINEAEARRADEFSIRNIAARNQAALQNIGFANQYDAIDSEAEGRKQAYLDEAAAETANLAESRERMNYMKDKDKMAFEIQKQAIPYTNTGDYVNVWDGKKWTAVYKPNVEKTKDDSTDNKTTKKTQSYKPFNVNFGLSKNYRNNRKRSFNISNDPFSNS